METKLKTLEDNRVEVQVSIDEKTVDNAIDKAYKEFAKKYNFPGFRKGKAPRPVIDNALGAEAALATATDEVINSAYPQVIEQEKLFPAGRPDFGDDAVLVEAHKPFTFTFTLEIKPEYKLSSYDPVSVELPQVETSEYEIDDQIEVMLSHYADYVDAPDKTALSTDNVADVAIKATDSDGNLIDYIATDSRLYMPEKDIFPAEFDKQVLGLKKGDTKSFKVEVAPDDNSILLSEEAGKTVTFDVTINAVKVENTPELTDEWVKETLKLDNIAALRDAVKAQIDAQKDDIIPRMKENLASAELVKRLEGEVPEGMIEEEEAHLLQDFFTQLQRQGMGFDSYLSMQGLTPETFKKDVKHQAEDNVKQHLALDAWARNKGIEASDAEITEEFVQAGVPNPEEVEKEWRNQGRLYLIREGVVRTKAMRDVLDSAKVTEVDFAKRAKEGNAKK